MGSESNNGWWKSLFQRSNRSRHEARDEQLGGYGAGAFSGQADSSLETYFDEVSIDGVVGVFFIEYLCSCGLPVVRLHGDGSFGCLHCDSVCMKLRCVDCYALMNQREGDEEDSDI